MLEDLERVKQSGNLQRIGDWLVRGSDMPPLPPHLDPHRGHGRSFTVVFEDEAAELVLDLARRNLPLSQSIADGSFDVGSEIVIDMGHAASILMPGLRAFPSQLESEFLLREFFGFALQLENEVWQNQEEGGKLLIKRQWLKFFNRVSEVFLK